MKTCRKTGPARVRTSLIAAVGAGALLAACSGPSVEERETRVQQSLADGDIQAARLDLISILQEEPGNHAARLQLIEAYLMLEDGEGAAAQIERLAPDATDPEERALLEAEAALYRGLPRQTLNLLQGIDTADAHRIRSRAFVLQNDYESARAALQEGLQADGERGLLLSDLALFTLADGDLAEAERFARQAARIAPGTIGTHLALGRVALAKGNAEGALNHFDTVLGQRRDHAAAILGKADALGMLERFDALDTLIAANTETLGHDLRFVVLQARRAATQENWGEVRTLLQSHERELRGQPEATYLYAYALAELGRPELARSYLNRLATMFPDDPRIARLRHKIASGGRT